MDENTEDKWLTRQDLADRLGLPVKTPAEWASKGDWSTVCEVRAARPIPAQRRNRLGATAIHRRQARLRRSMMGQ